MKLTKQEENRILELLKRDPERGLEMVMDRFGPSVKWIAKTILGSGSQQDVEECVSETFVRLWRSAVQNGAERSGFDPSVGTSLYGYTCGIARHVALDLLRHRRGDTVSLEAAAPADGRSFDAADIFSQLRCDSDFAAELAAEECRAVVYEAVDDLEPPDREIFLLRYWLELSVKRIAEVLNLTEKQVENHLYRGKKTLRKILEGRGILDDR